MWAVCAFLLAMGVAGLAVGVWRIFHPEKRWAGVLAGFWTAMALAGWALRTAPGEVPAFGAGGIGFVLALGASVSIWLAFFPPVLYARRFRAAGESPEP